MSPSGNSGEGGCQGRARDVHDQPRDSAVGDHNHNSKNQTASTVPTVSSSACSKSGLSFFGK